MKQINNYGIPQHGIRLCPETYQPKADRIGVNALCDSPRIRTLQLTRWDDIERDIACSLAALGGIALHQRAESFAEQNEQAEQKLEDFVDSKGTPLGITIVGKADVYNQETKQIRDWKSVAVYGLKWPDKIKKFTEQLNCYVWQRRIRQQLVESLWLDVYWSDWSISHYEKAADKIYKKDCTFDLSGGGGIGGYPPIKYSEVKLPLWTFEQQENFIKEKINYHLVKPLDCDDVDSWLSSPQWRIEKTGRKSSLRNLDSYEKALTWCNENDIIVSMNPLSLKKGYSITKKEGKHIRCNEWYCPVFNVCKGKNENNT